MYVDLDWKLLTSCTWGFPIGQELGVNLHPIQTDRQISHHFCWLPVTDEVQRHHYLLHWKRTQNKGSLSYYRRKKGLLFKKPIADLSDQGGKKPPNTPPELQLCLSIIFVW